MFSKLTVLSAAIWCVFLVRASYSVYEFHEADDGSCAVGTITGVVVYINPTPLPSHPCTSMGWLSNYARQYVVESPDDIVTTGMDWAYDTHETDCSSKVIRNTYGRFGCQLYNMGSGDYFVNSTHLVFRAQSFPPPSQYNHTRCPDLKLARDFPIALGRCTVSLAAGYYTVVEIYSAAGCEISTLISAHATYESVNDTVEIPCNATGSRENHEHVYVVEELENITMTAASLTWTYRMYNGTDCTGTVVSVAYGVEGCFFDRNMSISFVLNGTHVSGATQSRVPLSQSNHTDCPDDETMEMPIIVALGECSDFNGEVGLVVEAFTAPGATGSALTNGISGILCVVLTALALL